MKKLFTLIAAGFMLLPTAKAQRTVDLQVTLISPKTGATIDSNVAFNYTFEVKNIGTNPLKAGDSIIYGTFIAGGLVNNTLYILSNKTGKIMNQNDTFIFSIPAWKLNYTTQTKKDTTIQFCTQIVPLNRSADSVKDLSNTNNSSCSSILLKAHYNSGSTGITITEAGKVTNTVLLYPNPTQSLAKFVLDMQARADVNIRVIDITGRTVINENKGLLGGKNTIAINTAELQNGLYLYQVRMGEDVQTGKMVIEK